MSTKAEPQRSTDRDLATRLLLLVARTRAIELAMQRHIAEHGFGGFWHPGMGQEGAQVGTAAALRTDDQILFTHRGVGHVVGKGMALDQILGDLFTRITGSTGGKGAGTTHFCAPELGILGQGGTLGSVFPVGAGVALANQLRGLDRVCVAVFGDGAAARGTFHEAALQASVWKLPVVWVCENNGLALSAPFLDQSPTAHVADRAGAYGMPGIVVDGQDAVAVHAAVTEAVERARSGGGPSLVEAETLRFGGHYEGDRQRYRRGLDAGSDVERDPLHLLRRHVDTQQADALEAQARDEVDAAFRAALAAPEAPDEIVLQHVWA